MARPRAQKVLVRDWHQPLGSDHLAREMPRTCPSPLLPTLGEGWLPLGLSPLEAWVAAGRTGWEQPLPLGAEVSTWRAPRVADANTAAHTWSPSRAACSLHVLPSPPSPGCHGRARRAPAPGLVGRLREQPVGNQVRPKPGHKPRGPLEQVA